MSRRSLELMGSPQGSIGDNAKLTLSIPTGPVYEAFYLETNIPVDKLSRVAIANAANTIYAPSGDFVKVMEEHYNRTVTTSGGGFLPLQFADIDARTLPGQAMGAIVTQQGDSWLMTVELGALGTAPAGGWYLKVWSETSDPMVLDQNGTLVRRVRTHERRLEQYAINAQQGEVPFKDLLRGPGVRARALYIKGDVSEVRILAKRNGQQVKDSRFTKAVNDLIMTRSGQRLGLKPVSGWMIIDFTASGFGLADLLPTDYDQLDFVLQVDTAGTVEIKADLILSVQR